MKAGDKIKLKETTSDNRYADVKKGVVYTIRETDVDLPSDIHLEGFKDLRYDAYDFEIVEAASGDPLETLWLWVDTKQSAKMEEEAYAGAEDCAAARCSGYLEAAEDILTKIEEMQERRKIRQSVSLVVSRRRDLARYRPRTR